MKTIGFVAFTVAGFLLGVGVQVTQSAPPHERPVVALVPDAAPSAPATESTPPLPERVAITGDNLPHREIENAELRDKLARMTRLAYQAAPEESMALALGWHVEEVQRTIMRSHLLDSAADLQLALNAVGAEKLGEILTEEVVWLRDLATKSRKAKEEHGAITPEEFQLWYRDGAIAQRDKWITAGLPFSLAENFRRIIAE